MSENELCEWTICPRCDTVQPILKLVRNSEDEEVMHCGFCFHGKTRFGDCCEPNEFDPYGWLVPQPTKNDINDFVTKIKDLSKPWK